jgi:hypothetical protein
MLSVQGSAFKVQRSRFSVQGSAFKVQRSRFSVLGSGALAASLGNGSTVTLAYLQTYRHTNPIDAPAIDSGDEHRVQRINAYPKPFRESRVGLNPFRYIAVRMLSLGWMPGYRVDAAESAGCGADNAHAASG